jgi:transcriptional regulator with XRE-family HTH domain
MSTAQSSEPFDQRKIGELIERREHLGISQRELEERLGVSARMVAKWESRMRSPTAANLDRWAQALGLKLTFRRQ